MQATLNMPGKNTKLQYCDANSILIINNRGILRRLYTPFKVCCCKQVGRFTVGTYAFVEEVASGDTDELIYLIGEAAYHHRHFLIVAVF